MNVVFKQTGDSVDYVPVADVKAGDVVIQGDLAGVAKLDIPAGKLGALALTGVLECPKATGAGAAIPPGTRVFWDETAKVATGNDGGGANKFLGKTVKAAGDDDSSVRVRLSQ